MRRLMSFDTSVTSASGCARLSASVWPRMALSAPWPGSVGRSESRTLVWKNSRPLGVRESGCAPFFAVGSLRPRSISSLAAPCISSSRNRLTWRTLRADSERPFLPASSSSSTIIGMYTSCSSKRKIAVGSCIRTFVSSTKIERRARVARVIGSRSPSQGPGGGENLVGVSRDLDLAPLGAQHAAGVDQERAALNAHVLAAVHALFLVDLEQLADRAIGVGQQFERKPILRLELFVRGDAVRRDADDGHLCPAELGVQVPEGLALLRAAGRVVLRVEVQHQLRAGRVLEAPLAGGRRRLEIRDLLADCDFRHARCACPLSS